MSKYTIQIIKNYIEDNDKNNIQLLNEFSIPIKHIDFINNNINEIDKSILDNLKYIATHNNYYHLCVYLALFKFHDSQIFIFTNLFNILENNNLLYYFNINNFIDIKKSYIHYAIYLSCVFDDLDLYIFLVNKYKFKSAIDKYDIESNYNFYLNCINLACFNFNQFNQKYKSRIAKHIINDTNFIPKEKDMYDLYCNILTSNNFLYTLKNISLIIPYHTLYESFINYDFNKIYQILIRKENLTTDEIDFLTCDCGPFFKQTDINYDQYLKNISDNFRSKHKYFISKYISRLLII